MATFVGLKPWEWKRMEPREVHALMDGDARRFGRLVDVVAWGVWMICSCIPWTGLPKEASSFMVLLRKFSPPHFIPPNKR